MAITLTTRLGLTQWGAGADPPSRAAFNTAFSRIDGAVAVDDGTNPSMLPTSGVNGQALADGRYAHVVSGTYRQLYRRAAGAWSQVGGNTWAETRYQRADPALGTGAASVVTSHPSLSNPSATEYWDGSSTRGGRQAVGDLNAAQPGALHLGDTTSAVDLTARGRLYALTAGNNGRAIVAKAHAAAAGPLFVAQDPTGAEPWTINAAGQMRSQAATAFGGAGLTVGVPFASAPGANDTSAADLYATGAKPALRLFRAAGDQIGSVLPDSITLGKASWTGGVIGLTAPTINLVGTVAITGGSGMSVSAQATVGTLLVSGGTQINGTTAAQAITATSVISSGQARGATVVADGQLTAQGGLVQTVGSGSGALVTSRPPVMVSGTNQQSVRQAHICTRYVNPVQGMPPSEAYIDIPFVMPEDGWLRLDATMLVKSDAGASNDIEPAQGYFIFDLRNSGGLVQSGPLTHGAIAINDDTGRQQQSQLDVTYVEVYSTRITAGNYTLRVRYSRTSVLVPYWMWGKFIFTPVVLHSTS